jgi:hypothetical protein
MSSQPGLSTLDEWVERFVHLVRPVILNGEETEAVLVVANRTGDAGVAEQAGEFSCADGSCVVGVQKGEGRTTLI